MEKLTLEKFKNATQTVKEVTIETKLIYSEFFSKQSGNTIYFKPENMQYTGAYKLRGAYYKISTLSDAEKSNGLITASAGNHAQGLAYAAKLANVKATVCMPTVTPLIKINRTKAYGAQVVLEGDVFDDACAAAYRIADETGACFVHPFNDLDVATGQGSVAMEIIDELPDVDIILVPIGGGGLITGVATLAKLINSNIKVIGVEPANADCIKSSLKAGKIVTLDKADTIADGTAVKRGGDLLFPYIKENVDDIITIEDEELIVSFLDIVENHKMIAENSGLLTVAALKHLDVKNKKIVCILSGGNMDVITMSSLIQHGLIQRDRIFTVSVLLPDKPGELAKVSAILASEKGNVVKLEHNQFVSINRNAAVELRLTIEAYGTEHKNAIVGRLKQEGYRPKLVNAKGAYM
jgi:threonine ammonia-lyase